MSNLTRNERNPYNGFAIRFHLHEVLQVHQYTSIHKHRFNRSLPLPDKVLECYLMQSQSHIDKVNNINPYLKNISRQYCIIRNSLFTFRLLQQLNFWFRTSPIFPFSILLFSPWWTVFQILYTKYTSCSFKNRPSEILMIFRYAD